MPHDSILQRIMISISTLSKYVREKKNKKRSICTGWCLHPVQMPPCHVAGWRAHVYRVEALPGISPVQMLDHICTSSMPGTNEGFELVQKTVVAVVINDIGV
jgi:hypothetical protein